MSQKFKSPGIYTQEVDMSYHYIDDYHIYCPDCYTELRRTFYERQYCHKCRNDVHYITKDEMREVKINKLISEYEHK